MARSMQTVQIEERSRAVLEPMVTQMVNMLYTKPDKMPAINIK